MKILIVSCLLDDHDGEMQGMSDCLGRGLTRLGHNVQQVSFPELTALFKNKYQIVDEVYFAGHSRFQSPELTPIPLNSRRIGGYTCEEIAKAVYVLATKHMSHHHKLVHFFDCEIALSNRTKSMPETINEEGTPIVHLEDFHWDPSLPDEELSSLQKICHLMLQTAKEQVNSGFQLEVRGLNGLGHITPDDIQGHSFDQEYLYLANEIKVLESTGKKRSKKMLKVLSQKQDLLLKHIRKKSSPHQLGYRLDSMDLWDNKTTGSLTSNNYSVNNNFRTV